MRRPVLLLGAAGLAACGEIAAPVPPCEYVGRPLTDSTAVIGYKTLPCWDATLWRVVRKR